LKLANKRDRYYDPAAQNFVALQQIWAECANYAITQNRNLNDYHVLTVVMYLTAFARGFGGYRIGQEIAFSQPSGTDQDALSIDITLAGTKQLGTMTIGEQSGWGRYAHEFGHNIVVPAAVLPEDIYASGEPASDATGGYFDIMGWCDDKPLFSGYNLDGLGWFRSDIENIRSRQWSTAPFKEEFDIVAHGLIENTDLSRCHLVRIKVSSGLLYYIEVRQRPGATAQLFDPLLPVPAGQDGGVVVTRSINGTVNNNEFIRLITLLQTSDTTLTTGQVAVDPLRTILITVINDSVQARPRICRVGRVGPASNAHAPRSD
jgi:hypothetical protein